jgi:hypothetical protein
MGSDQSVTNTLRCSWDRQQGMRAKLRGIKEELRQRMHQPIPEDGRWLAQVVGYFAYHAVPTNFSALRAFRHHVTALWE